MSLFQTKIYTVYGYSVTRTVLFFLFVAFSLPLLVFSILLAIWFPDSRYVQGTCGLILMITLAVCWLMATKTAYFMVEQRMEFGIAFLHCILPYTIPLRWMPGAQRLSDWISSRCDYKNPYTIAPEANEK